MKSSPARAPVTLMSAEARAWWRRLQQEYGISDEGGRLLLQTAMEAYQRMRDAQEAVSAEGMTVKDRFGAIKVHPLLNVERDCRAQMLAALKALRLDVEPVKAPGRPGGS